MQSPTSVYLESKNHYPILDGLRGVASVLVIFFHVFEAFTGGNRFIQIINHGYLAVDFFFLLSGFVVAYAYDDRWDRMTTWDFYKRRLVRLQPMVVMGSMIGAALFYFQVSNVFPLIAGTPPWKMLLLIVSIALAYACLKLYDEPVREWLKKKVLLKNPQRRKGLSIS